MAFGITDLKKGTIFEYNAVPYKVVEYSQKVMGRGGSIVNVKIKSLIDGRVLDKTFKGNDSIEQADVTSRSVQYLYNDGTKYYFMDEKSYDQFEVDSSLIGDQSGYLKDGDKVQAQWLDVKVIGGELPKKVML